MEQIATALQDRKLKVVARETGLHYHTVRRLATEKDVNPKLTTMRTLSEYLTRKPGA
jgi:hypothetical protein